LLQFREVSTESGKADGASAIAGRVLAVNFACNSQSISLCLPLKIHGFERGALLLDLI